MTVASILAAAQKSCILQDVNILHKYLILFIFSSLLLSCRAKAPSDGIVVIIDGDPGRLDPRYATSGYGVKLNRLIFAGLTRLADDLSARPDVALSITRKGDGATVRLRPDVRFADGTRLTSNDVLYTLRSITRSIPRPSPYAHAWRDLVSVTAPDPLTVKMTFSAPHPHLAEDLEFPVLPSAWLKRHGHAFGPDSMFGAGPYRLVSRKAGLVVLEANPFYFRGAPQTRRIYVRVIEDENTRALLMASGTADLAQNVLSPLLVPSLKKRGLRVQTGPSNILTYLGFNTDSPKLADVRVRRAIAMAIDRRAIIKARFGGAARLADSVLPAFHWAHASNPVPYAPDEARRLLDEAGFPEQPGSQPRMVLEYKTSSNPFRVALARLIAGQLASVGIEVRVRSFEWGVFYSDLKHRRFEMVSLQMPEIILPDVYCWFFPSWMIPQDGKGGGNRWGMRSEVLDRACRQLEHETDREEIRRLAAIIQKEVARQMPIFPLWHEDNLAVTSPRLHYTLIPTARLNLYDVSVGSARN